MRLVHRDVGADTPAAKLTRTTSRRVPRRVGRNIGVSARVGAHPSIHRDGSIDRDGSVHRGARVHTGSIHRGARVHTCSIQEHGRVRAHIRCRGRVTPSIWILGAPHTTDPRLAKLIRRAALVIRALEASPFDAYGVYACGRCRAHGIGTTLAYRATGLAARHTLLGNAAASSAGLARSAHHIRTASGEHDGREVAAAEGDRHATRHACHSSLSQRDDHRAPPKRDVRKSMHEGGASKVIARADGKALGGCVVDANLHRIELDYRNEVRLHIQNEPLGVLVRAGNEERDQSDQDWEKAP